MKHDPCHVTPNCSILYRIYILYSYQGGSSIYILYSHQGYLKLDSRLKALGTGRGGFLAVGEHGKNI